MQMTSTIDRPSQKGIETATDQSFDWTSFQRIELRKNQVLGPQEEYPVLILVCGSLLLQYRSEDHERSYNTLLRGPSIVRMDLEENQKSFAVASILDECHVVAINHKQLMEMMVTDVPRFQYLLQLSFKQLRRLDERADELLTKKDAELRLLNFLDYESRTHGSQMLDNSYLQLPLSHRQIADIIFACRQSVSSTLSNLRKLDLIAYDRRSMIIHRARFAKYLRSKSMEHAEQEALDKTPMKGFDKRRLERVSSALLQRESLERWVGV